MEQHLITRKTELSAHVVSFCRYLRGKGLTIGPAEEADALKALATLPLRDRDSFRIILRAVLARSLEQQLRFDDAFNTYWNELAKAVDSKVKDGETGETRDMPSKPKEPKDSFEALKNWLYGNQSEEEKEVASYSSAEALSTKDFSTMTGDELEDVGKLIAKIAKILATRSSRRFEKAKRGSDFDLRRTMRLNMRRGGEIIDLAYRRRRIQKLKLVMLCDVSKSMDLYSRFLVQFIYAFQQNYRQIETFVFSTGLHRITETLRERSFEEALTQLSWRVPDWSGGTRIGASLQEYVKEYGENSLDSRTVVLIMSDGWDTGETEELESSMQFISRKASKVVWLNPLAGSDVYEPSTKGMEVAMPYIDVFAPAHNVESLKSVLKHLKPGIR